MPKDTRVASDPPATLFIATAGAASVVKAVCVDRGEPRCACVGGNSDGPPGFGSPTGNARTMGMARVMPVRLVARRAFGPGWRSAVPPGI